MEGIYEVRINNVSEFIQTVSQIHEDKKRLWFRGQGQDDRIKYRLLPNIYRNSLEVYPEHDFYLRFKAKAVPYLTYQPTSEWDWLFLMQHHGVPTRLLDWTEEALIALAFAIQNRYSEDEIEFDSVVWCLEPTILNSNCINGDNKFIPNIEEKEISSAFNMASRSQMRNNFPAAIIGSLNSDRIVSQKGVFTIFPKPPNVVPLEELPGANNFLSRIIINKNEINGIQQELFRLGITEGRLYPDLDSVAKEILREYKE
ncbi:FRG domain-containing protein [Planococcus maritimus]|nr:FRG domain-containing protein [Planococcus sp. SK3692]MDE4084544.1 FRG domain-containing protein [Planococcus maritimus]